MKFKHRGNHVNENQHMLTHISFELRQSLGTIKRPHRLKILLPSAQAHTNSVETKPNINKLQS